MTLTHAELVTKAADWLCRRWPVVITELVTGASETPDVIAFGGWRGAALVECKASRADFLADRKKFFRKHPASGMGGWRYYLGPHTAFCDDEVPEKWGVLRFGPRGGVHEVREPQYFENHNMRAECQILVSTLRRIGHQAPEGVSIRCYSHQTKNTASVSIDPGEYESP